MYVHTPRSYFYPDQLRKFLSRHASDVPIGQVTAADLGKPYLYSIVRPNRFRFVYELWSASYLPLNFYISMRTFTRGLRRAFTLAQRLSSCAPANIRCFPL